MAWPTVLTMTSYTIMQFVDALMVGQVGPESLAAQGNGGVWAFVPIAIGMGILTVVNTFVSQNLGAGRPREGARYAWAALWLAVVGWVCVLLPMAAVLPMIFRGLHLDPADPATVELVRMETTYGQILLVGGVITMSARGIHQYFFGMHRPKIVTVSAFAGNGVNVLVNYALIFGRDGLPDIGLPGIPGIDPMGVTGAAIGTVIGTLVELLIPLAVFLGPSLNRAHGTRSAWRPDPGAMRDLFRLGWPAAGQYGNELICWAIFMTGLVGAFGTDHMAAGWVALRYMHLCFMPAVGFSTAVTSIVGRFIGAGHPEVAMKRARLGVGMALVYMTIGGLVLFLWRDELVRFFFAGSDRSAEQIDAIVEIGARLMICAAVFQTFDALGIVYAGALRGAGDTVWPGIVTMVYSWTFIVGGGWLMTVIAPQWTSVGPWIGAAAFIICLGLTMTWRFESGAWRGIRLVETDRADGSADGEPGPEDGFRPVAGDPLAVGDPAGPVEPIELVERGLRDESPETTR